MEECQRCKEVGEDRRTLKMACFYEMDELGMPFKHAKIITPVAVELPNTKKIPLSNSKLKMIVDDEDYEKLSKYNWLMAKRGNVTYAARDEWTEGKHKKIYAHRDILSLNPNDKKQVDHVDGNTLNNSKINLRLCTPEQNNWNKPKHKDNVSGFKGVSWHKSRNKWAAYIKAGSTREYLGLFDNIYDAAMEYDKAAKRLHGKFAYLNFPNAYPDKLYTLRTCKECRGLWMAMIKFWYDIPDNKHAAENSGIFVRELGATIEISEAEWYKRNPGVEPVRFKDE